MREVIPLRFVPSVPTRIRGMRSIQSMKDISVGRPDGTDRLVNEKDENWHNNETSSHIESEYA